MPESAQRDQSNFFELFQEQQGTIEKLKGQNTFLKGLRQNSDELLKKQEVLD